jgi:lipopolysaccharide/colanic/teichoic acid biosynthesis glycosyltransferase
MGMKRGARALVVLGPLVVVLGLSKYHAAAVASPPYDFVSSFRFPWAVGYVVLLWAAAYAVGLPSQRATRRGAVLAAIAASATAAMGISVAQLLAGAALLPRFVVLGTTVILVPWYLLCARMAVDFDERARDATRVVVVGDLADVGSLWVDLEGDTERPATLAAVLTVEEAAVRRTGAPLVEAAARAGVAVVVLDSAAQREPSVIRQAALLHERGVRIRSLSAFYEEWLGKLPLAELERVSLMFDIAEIHGGRYARLKRLLDVAAGAAASLALFVAVPVVALGNVVANRGPLWFRQERVGKDGRIFTMLKFRTMRPDGTGSPTGAAGTWTASDDPRVTPFGRFLRRTHLDELPQAWNILRGDLSIVGPRPEQPRYVEELSGKLPFYGLRHLVRPGLTGWAQVKYGYAGDHQDALEKLQYEFFYLRHQSLLLDLRVMVRTLRSVTGGAGRGR